MQTAGSRYPVTQQMHSVISKTCSSLRQYHHLCTHLIAFGLKFQSSTQNFAEVDNSNKQLQPVFVYLNYQVPSITCMAGIMRGPIREKTIIGISEKS